MSLVVKLGGSLFDLPELKHRLQELADSIPEPIWIVPGGGKFADEIRRLDEIHRWPPQISHRLALRSMSLAAHMLASLCPDFELVADLNSRFDFSEVKLRSRPRIIDVAGLTGLEQLPATWDLTSDSVAAWVAGQFPVGKLLLAKSRDLPSPFMTFGDAATHELVDRYFPTAAAGLSEVSWINLRAPHLAIKRWPG
ncbi:hypothetical protein SH661x_003099 [Planctomicrobium sp. SH661]|uniref:amino acid kinase family protein n=1 Tax=Planctomicrobium sp. SH661 TaxID=3448124 RepID=UPI003F5C6ED5